MTEETNTQSLKKLNKALEKLNEKTGNNFKLASELKNAPLLETPFATLNAVVGGIPRGKFTTVAGPQHAGKGAFCLQLLAYHMQKDPNFLGLWSDLENAFDYDWAAKLGVDLDRLIIQKYTREVDIMEKILDNALDIIKSTDLINLWVIDSIGALLPKGDIRSSQDKERSLEEANMLNLQRKLGEFFRKANPIIAPNKDYEGCAVLSIGQIYLSPDQYVGMQVRGGEAFKHWAHLRLMFDRAPKKFYPEQIEMIGSDGEKRKIYPGWAGRIKIDKTRINQNEGKEVILKFMLGRGFDSKESVIAAAFGLEIIQRAGAVYRLDILPDGQIKGKDNLIDYFMTNDDAFAKLQELVNQSALQEHINLETKQEINNHEQL